ncbi:MAG: hypothetical protein EPO07_06815 [Verrucomicrobia bacterium]|nr:MAG: hypothetical protein EPO07_06815 [Verrucomicrobiota bacterium]
MNCFKLFAVACVATRLCSPTAFGQSAQADMIKRRAKGMAEQNNASQGVPPPAKPAAPGATPTKAPPAVAPTPATPQQAATAKIRAALAPLTKAESGTLEHRQALAKELLNAARGADKPFAATVAKVADSLAAALPQASALAANDQQRIAQNLEALVNCSTMPRKQADAAADDVMTVLQAAGASRSASVAVANSAKAVIPEVQKTAKP